VLSLGRLHFAYVTESSLTLVACHQTRHKCCVVVRKTPLCLRDRIITDTGCLSSNDTQMLCCH